MNTTVERKPLPLPGGHDKVLLHSCCAPKRFNLVSW